MQVRQHMSVFSSGIATSAFGVGAWAGPDSNQQDSSPFVSLGAALMPARDGLVRVGMLMMD